MRAWQCTILGLFFGLITSPLFAGSITNEGPAPVKISLKSSSGIGGGGTLQPGQTIPARQKLLWLEHVPEGPATEIRIKIVDDNGATSYITTSGGRHTFTPPVEETPKKKTPSAAESVPRLQPGHVTNHSNVQLYVTFVSSRLGSQRTQVVMPSQTLTVPQDTVEVRTQPVNSSFKDTSFFVEVVMPDGTQQTIRSAQGSVYTGQKVN